MAVYVNNITINTGEYFSRDFYLDNINGTPLNLVGYAASSYIRKHPESLNPTAKFNVGFIDRDNGRIRLSLGSTITTAIKPGRYVYDVLFTDTEDKKSIVIEGNVLATEDISDRCVITSYANDSFGAISEDSSHDSGIGPNLTQITIDDINEWGVVAFGHYDNFCIGLPNLTTKFQEADYMAKIQRYLQFGGVVFYIGEYFGCGDVAAHNTRLGLLGTSIRLGSRVDSNSSASLVLSNNAAQYFPPFWEHAATNNLDVNSGTAIYAHTNGTYVTVAYEKVGNGAIVVVGDSNGSSKTPSADHYNGFRALVTNG
jgi:hypothetical protein